MLNSRKQFPRRNGIWSYCKRSQNNAEPQHRFSLPSHLEGFGLPPLEAMACGAPVVSSNSASLPEVVGDAAILVDPHDLEQIANAMRLVLTQPALAAALREKGLARAAQFSWERTALVILTQLLGG